MRELSLLWLSLQDAEYLHLLLEPLPLFGLGFGVLILAASLALRDWRMRVVATALIVLSCASVHWYVTLRIKSEPRVIALQDMAFQPLIRQQTARRSDSTWIYYSAATCSVAAMFRARGGKGVIVTSITLAVCAGAFVHALWLHKKECEVYHRNTVKYAPVR